MPTVFIIRDFSETDLVRRLRGVEREPPPGWEVVAPGLDGRSGQGQVFQDVIEPRIGEADRALAFVDSANANVAFEIGFALGRGVPVQLVRVARDPPAWLDGPPAAGVLVERIDGIDELRRVLAAEPQLEPPPRPSAGAETVLLCPRQGEGSAVREDVARLELGWRASPDVVDGPHARAEVRTPRDWPEALAGVGRVVWMLAAAPRGTPRDGVESARYALLAGYAYGAGVELAVMRLEPCRRVVDVAHLEQAVLGPTADLGAALDRIAGRDREREALIDYLERLRRELDTRALAFLPAPDAAVDPKLSQVYVEVRTLAGDEPSPEEGAAHRIDAPRGRTLAGAVLGERSRLLGVLGEPGCGKTTLLRQLAIDRCGEALAELRAGREPPALSVPVYVALNEGRVDMDEHLGELVRRGWPQETARLVREQARRGRVLVLYDGLDEVPAPLAVRQTVDRVAQVAAGLPAGCKVVVASRLFGYVRPSTGELRELQVLPLDDGAQRELLGHYVADPDDRDRLHAHLRSTFSLRALAGNPFHLTLVALLARQDRSEGREPEPPERRSDMLRTAVSYLLHGSPRRPTDPESASPDPDRHRLEHVALGMLERGGRWHDERAVGRDLDERCAECPASAGSVHGWLVDVAGRSGILERYRGAAASARWAFAHRHFQEHLAAARLAQAGKERWGRLVAGLRREGDPDPDRLAQLAETFALLAGEIGSEADALLVELAKIDRDLAIRALASAGAGTVRAETVEQLMDLGGGGDAWRARREVIERIPQLFRAGDEAVVDLLCQVRGATKHGADLWFVRETLRGLARSEHSAVRRRAHDELEPGVFFQHLADPPDLAQAEVELADGSRAPYWCAVPHPEGAYRIGRAPVTNAQYERFDPSHDRDREFTDEVDAAELGRHPVVRVTWYEAKMYCAWLATHPANGRVDLPEQDRWEWAATGGDAARKYPWGAGEPTAELANFDEKVGHTTAVGSYPKGAGPFGTVDQAGTVWEWCDDDEGEAGGEPLRALRGGSCFDPALFLAAAFRFRFRSRYRNDVVGFRVVSSSSPEP